MKNLKNSHDCVNLQQYNVKVFQLCAVIENIAIDLQ